MTSYTGLIEATIIPNNNKISKAYKLWVGIIKTHILKMTDQHKGKSVKRSKTTTFNDLVAK